MLSVAPAPARAHRAAFALAAACWAGCSVLPPAHYPAFADHLFAAEFVVPEAGRLQLPTTTRDVVVQELRATPPPQRELFGDGGERWFVYPPGAEVHVVCRCRSYAPPDGQALTPQQLLPGARHIEVRTTP